MKFPLKCPRPQFKHVECSESSFWKLVRRFQRHKVPRDEKVFFLSSFIFKIFDHRHDNFEMKNEKNFMFQQMKIGRGGQSLFELILKHRNNWNLSPHKFFSCTQMATFPLHSKQAAEKVDDSNKSFPTKPENSTKKSFPIHRRDFSKFAKNVFTRMR